MPRRKEPRGCRLVVSCGIRVQAEAVGQGLVLYLLDLLVVGGLLLEVVVFYILEVEDCFLNLITVHRKLLG